MVCWKCLLLALGMSRICFGCGGRHPVSIGQVSNVEPGWLPSRWPSAFNVQTEPLLRSAAMAASPTGQAHNFTRLPPVQAWNVSVYPCQAAYPCRCQLGQVHDRLIWHTGVFDCTSADVRPILEVPLLTERTNGKIETFRWHSLMKRFQRIGIGCR